MSDEILGLEALSADALRDRHAANTARLAELAAAREAGTLTLAEAQEHRRLAIDTNAVVEALTVVLAPVEAVNDLPTVPVPEAVASDAATETFVVGQEADMAEAMAAAAALSAAVSVRHEPVTADDVAAPRQTLVASAAATLGAFRANEAVTLDDVGAMVRQFAHDKGQNGKSLPLVTLAPAMQASAGIVSSDNSRSENTRIFAEQVRNATAQSTPTGLVAAADPFDICGPADILRDVPQCDNAERYVPSWFRQVQSTHGQIQFYRGFGIADVIGGVNTWDQTQQDLVDPADPTTWKDCLDIGCLPTVTAGVEAVTQCISMPVFQSMTSPEAVGSAISAVRAATARVGDGQLLRMFDDLSSSYTQAAGTFGATITVYDVIGRLMGAFAAANRQLDMSGYTIGIEAGLLQHLHLDNAMACNGREAAEAAEELFRDLGFGRIAVTPDFSDAVGTGPWSPFLPINPPGGVAIAVPARPTTWRIRLFDSNDFAMMSPGGDTFGIIPDLANKRQNKVTWFGELSQGLAKLGCKPAATVVFSGLAANGKRAACV